MNIYPYIKTDGLQCVVSWVYKAILRQDACMGDFTHANEDVQLTGK